MDPFKNLLDPDRFPCMTKIWKPLIPTRRDRYLSPEELKQTVIQSSRIGALVDELSQNYQTKQDELVKSIKEMLNEIGLSRSLPVMRWSGIFLNKIFKKICTGIYVNEDSISGLKETMGDYPFLYLPSHRSYADFILMSYICFAYDIEVPAIAAGMDFYTMFGIGSLLRKTGAFFMRRSFSNDRLYWTVFKEYMRSLLTVYHTGVEFFIEGTRSRSLKAITPKVGLLSMALEPLYLSEVADVNIVPVGVAYEKPLEEQLFVYELLGVPKPRESTMGLFKALKVLDTNYGNMYINFGAPISVRQYLGSNLNRLQHAQLPDHAQHLSKDELIIINKLAIHIVSRQQQLIVLGIFNLISTYFNYKMYFDETTTLDQLAQGVVHLADFLRPLGAIVSVDPNNIKIKLLDSIGIHSNILQININGHLELIKSIAQIAVPNINGKSLKGHNLQQTTIRFVVPIISLQLYCNPCMYWLVMPAFIILSVNKLTKGSQTKDAIIAEVNQLKMIFSMEFVFEDDDTHTVDFLLNYLLTKNVLEINGSCYTMNEENTLSTLILSSIVPFLFCYHQVMETISTEFTTKSFSEKDVLIKVQEKVEIELNSKKDYVHPYCLSLDSINIAINSLHSNKILEKSKSTTKSIYNVNVESLQQLKQNLFEYCQVLPRTSFNHYFVFAKL